MTYKELNDRLSKCQLTLEKIKDGTYTPSKSQNIAKTAKNLELLKESLIKQLKEAEKGMIHTDDEAKAKDLADDGANVKLTKEQDGMKFSVDETKAIAKSVGKAVAMSVKSLGDEIGSMKATKIEENSFDIDITYKNDNEDSFSFYITDDTLHLTDFSFDKELTDVGVKPSGEAQVNVDHLANELTKHFKSQNEVVNADDTKGLKKLSKALKGSSKAHLDQKKKLDKDTKGIIKLSKSLKGSSKAHLDQKKKLDKLINTENISEGEFDEYEPQHFDICPGAQALRNELIKSGKTTAELGEWTKIHDDLFKLEKAVIASKNATPAAVEYAEKVREKLIHISRDLGINADKIHYLKGHVDIIKDIAAGKIDESPAGVHYIKVESTELMEALGILEKAFGDSKVKFELNDPNILYIHNADNADIHDAVEELQQNGIIIDETSIDNELEEMIKKEDMDVGHQDDEPGMLQTTAYETAQYAAKLVKKLQKYEQFDGEVDFPNWWQSKLILAKDYMQKAYHYLDSEEKQPAIDQLALEGDGMTTKIKPSEGDPTNMAYTDKVKEGRGDGEAINNIIIGMANEDGISTGEAAQEIIDHITHIFIDTKGTDEGKYKSDAQRKAIYATKAEKEGVNEVDEERFVRAAFEDLEQVIRNLAHTANISEDEALEMAIRKLEAMLDGRDDMEEGRNVDDLYDTTVNTMKRLAKKYKAGDKSVVTHLKKLTDIKKKLEQEKIKKASNIGKDQELDEAGPGFKHDCAAKVVHEKYGKGNCIPEKHTLVKENNKYVVTHYDVLFENGKTIKDIPVSELDIKTSNEHWHKGYKKKKK